MATKRKLSLKLFFLTGLAVSALGVALYAVPASPAVAAASFNRSRIIDDTVFTDHRSMTAAQIQSFLNSKVPECDTDGSEPSEYGGGTRADYGRSRGYPPPYICLRSFNQDGESAAQIIYDTAQEYRINPQVLIVLLQKEQGLVTDEWPFPVQYRSATGYGCPDTAACDSEYYGFKNQVRWAATMYRAIMDGSPTWYTPYVVGNNRIYYHPDLSRCGSTTVNIQNRATAALYNYTPYQPNQAALDADYGLGNSCSSYGNRNFFLYFKDWFGSTQGTPFFQIDNKNAVYILGANNTYYYIDSPAILRAYGWGETNRTIASYPESYISDRTFAGRLPNFVRFEGNEIYLADKGLRRHVPSVEVLNHYGVEVGDEAQLPASHIYFLRKASKLNQVARSLNDGRVYLVEDGEKRHFTGPSAYESGSPAFSSLPRTDLTTEYINKIPYGAEIYPSGSTIRIDSGSRVFLILNRNERAYISSPSLIKALGLSTSGIRNIPQGQANAYQNSSKQLGTFVVKKENNGIRLIDSETILAIPESIANSNNFNINRDTLTSFDNSILGRYKADGSSTQLLRAHGTSTVYKIENGEKRHVTSPEVLRSLGFDFEDVTDVSAHTLNYFPTGSPIS